MKYIKPLLAGAIALAIVGCSATQASKPVDPNSIDGVLPHNLRCSETVTIRYQSLSGDALELACTTLGKIQSRFHQLLTTNSIPVADDNNTVFRVNVYGSANDLNRRSLAHFNITADNPIYLEGLPSLAGKHAEFVSYVAHESIAGLDRGFVQYLDGRFNLYGQYCEGLHDDRTKGCNRATPLFPHLVWWMEGINSYVAKGDDNPAAIAMIKRQRYLLSDLFNTSYHRNGGQDRIGHFSYLAVRYMLEHQQHRVERMLSFTRKGDLEGYQALVKSWGRTMDQDFDRWSKRL